MISGIDHLIIRCEDLDPAIKDYERLGFTVIPGGRHPHGTHNALISFQDGSYLELIAFWDASAANDHPFRQGLGLTQYALASDDLESDVRAINQRGLEFAGPHDGARDRPDGVRVAWKTASYGDWENQQTLPFLIEDVTAREVRVPGGESARHDNGIRGLSKVVIDVADMPTTVERYLALLNVSPVTEPGDKAMFQIGAHQIELRASVAQEGFASAVLVGDKALDIRPERASGALLEVVAM